MNPREYLKLKYMGDCKCGNCQLVPPDMLELWARQIDRVESLRTQLGRAKAALQKIADLPPPEHLTRPLRHTPQQIAVHFLTNYSQTDEKGK